MATSHRLRSFVFRFLLASSLAASTFSCGTETADDENAASVMSSGEKKNELTDPLALNLDQDGPTPSFACNWDRLDICLKSNGGKACYPKWGCTPGQSRPPSKTQGAAFSARYLSEYSTIKGKVDDFYRGSFRCAAFASTALRHAGFNVTQKLITNEVETQLKGLGWTKVTDMGALRAGDVVFTDKATSNVPNTWSHVYVFHRYDGKGIAIISDNNGNGIRRNVGSGVQSTSKVAYRAP